MGKLSLLLAWEAHQPIPFPLFLKVHFTFFLKGLSLRKLPEYPAMLETSRGQSAPRRVGIHQLYVQEPWIYRPQVANHCSTINCSFCLCENERWFATYSEATMPAKSKVVGVGITQKKKKMLWKFENVCFITVLLCFLSERSQRKLGVTQPLVLVLMKGWAKAKVTEKKNLGWDWV